MHMTSAPRHQTIRCLYCNHDDRQHSDSRFQTGLLAEAIYGTSRVMSLKQPNAVLITGAARRIGRGLALSLAADGWLVAVHYERSANDADAVVAEIVASGGTAASVCCDLADADAASSLPVAAAEAVGTPLTCLINNASLFEYDAIGTLTADTFDRHLAINLRAPVLLSQSFARQLPDGATGNVINIIDQRVWRLTPEFFSYTLAKSGLWTVTRTLAQAFAPRIRVNAIGPGPVLQSIHQTPEEFAFEAASTPLGQGTSVEEVATCIRFILAAPAMTGQMIALDGGQHLDWRVQLVPAGRTDTL